MTLPMTGKLVRDRIPELIRASGTEPRTRVLGDDDFVASLRLKLVEEANEVHRAAESELIEELADVLEVIRALAQTCGATWASVEQAAERKRQDRGGFEHRIWLEHQ